MSASKDHLVLEWFRAYMYGTTAVVADDLNMHRSNTSLRIKRLVSRGVLRYDERAGTYHLAADDDGNALRLNLVAA